MLGQGGQVRTHAKGGYGRREISRAVCASKNAAFFSSKIDLAPAAPVQSVKVGYHKIAQAGSC